MIEINSSLQNSPYDLIRMNYKELEKKDFPKPLSLRKIIGPSFIILGLGLGSGEFILWPYLTSNYGMGIIWGAVIGLTFQFFMNMEIERYALVRGESIFMGFARKARWLSFWFLLSTFIPWIWPGIIATSGTILNTIFGFNNASLISIGLLILMGLILSLGPVLYKTVEFLEKGLILLGVPTIFILSIFLAKPDHWVAVSKGLVGVGTDYFLLPAGIAISSFLAALAYAGAGGNLNLAQSFYVKEKGYGMGKYAGKITSLLTGKKEEISLSGFHFDVNQQSLGDFKVWWKNINIEHFLVFWLTGSITIILLGLLSFATVFGMEGNKQGISFLIKEGAVIGQLLFPIAGTFFLLVGSLTLFGTQMTVFDATSRIMAENAVIGFAPKLSARHLRKTYYFVLWAQIIAGITIFLFGFNQPLQLLTMAAVMNAFAMFVHVGLTLWLNMTSLEKELRPSLLRIIAMSLGFLFYGGFSLYTIATEIMKFL